MWVCGLKLGLTSHIIIYNFVTPHVGVWIETTPRKPKRLANSVTPHVGVWIETYLTQQARTLGQSHPMWVCGLKRTTHVHRQRRCTVTPHVGVWIETNKISPTFLTFSSHPMWVCGLKRWSGLSGNACYGHTPCGCVD